MEFSIEVEQDGGEDIYVLYSNDDEVGAVFLYERENKTDLELFINCEYGEKFENTVNIDVYYGIIRDIISKVKLFENIGSNIEYSIVLSLGEDFKTIEIGKVLENENKVTFKVS